MFQCFFSRVFSVVLHGSVFFIGRSWKDDVYLLLAAINVVAPCDRHSVIVEVSQPSQLERGRMLARSFELDEQAPTGADEQSVRLPALVLPSELDDQASLELRVGADSLLDG
jgi:hypothetical protein